MERRDFLKAGLAAGALHALPGDASAAPEARRWYELRIYETRSDIAPPRLRTFFKDQLLPALQRAGTGPVGVFSAESGFPGQSVLVLIEHASAADALTLEQRLLADGAYAAAQRAFEGETQLPYVRYESRLMRAFAGHPRVEVPPARADRPRLFELRTYESRNTATLARKIAMFDEAEIALFRSIDMTPVAFGENMFGPRLPSLTYMLTFDDMAARMQAWNTFRTHPEWQRISRDPRWSVEGAVTVSHVALLNPLAFSQIR